MKTKCTFCAVTLLVLFALSSTGATAQVAGSGTTNTIPKWTGSTTLGDSAISEDAAGNVKIDKPVASNFRFTVFEQTGTKWAIFAASDYVALAGRTSTGTGVVGTTDNYTAYRSNTAVLGASQNGVGVYGQSNSSDTSQAGVIGLSQNGVGVFGQSNSSDTSQAGVIGLGVRGGAYAGRGMELRPCLSSVVLTPSSIRTYSHR